MTKLETIESLQTSVLDLCDKLCLVQVGEQAHEVRKWIIYATGHLNDANDNLNYAKRNLPKNEVEEWNGNTITWIQGVNK